jgi:8-oxo-dGTP diphosphatase
MSIFPAENMQSDDRSHPPRPIVGVGGVVISGESVLLVRRGKPPLEGQWSIPGGALEVGETVRDGVMRELMEETGIEVRVLDLIEVFERITRDSAGRTEYHYVILDYLCAKAGGEARAGSDAGEVAWAAEADLAKYSLAPSALYVIRKAFQMQRNVQTFG